MDVVIVGFDKDDNIVTTAVTRLVAVRDILKNFK